MPWPPSKPDIFLVVRDNRQKEALEAGLSPAEAWIFANDTVDIGVLRKLVVAGCDPALIARIII